MPATILIVEDEPTILTNTLDILRFEGYVAIGAQNGRVGLERAQQTLPDLILCDIMMPEMDGYAVLRGIRDDPQTSAIPIIMMSAKVDRETTAEAVEMGATHYLAKPFSMPELLNLVRATLKTRVLD